MPSGKALGRIEEIEDTELADAEEVAEKVNEILDRMRKRGWVDA